LRFRKGLVTVAESKGYWAINNIIKRVKSFMPGGDKAGKIVEGFDVYQIPNRKGGRGIVKGSGWNERDGSVKTKAKGRRFFFAQILQGRHKKKEET